MKINDPRFQRSRDALLASVTNLLDDDADVALSISNIVEKAGVTRPTFYKHFGDVQEAMQQAALTRLANAFPEPVDLTDLGEMSNEERVEYVACQTEPIFDHLRDYHRFYLRIMSTAGTFGFFDELVAFLAERILNVNVQPVAQTTKSPALSNDRSTFMASGALWLVVRWLASDFEGENTPARMARRVESLTVPLLE